MMNKFAGLLCFTALVLLPSAGATAPAPEFGTVTIENGSYFIEKSTTLYADDYGALRFRGDCTLTIAPDAVLTILGSADCDTLCGIVLESQSTLQLAGSVTFQQVTTPFSYDHDATLFLESATVYFATDSPPT